MNLQLSNTEEYIDQKLTGALGEVLIRCVRYNPLLYGPWSAKGYEC